MGSPHPRRRPRGRRVWTAGWSGHLRGRPDWVVLTQACRVARPVWAATLKVWRRRTRRTGGVHPRVGLHRVLTARPVGVRMGKGKGRPRAGYAWAARGSTLFDCPAAPAGVVRPAPLDRRWPTRVVRRRRRV